MVTIGTPNAPHVIEYELTSDSNLNGVNITCFFLDESTTGCVVVVHSVNSTRTLSGVMNITTYLFPRFKSEDSASGHIGGVNFQEYQFGVIGGEQRREEIQTNRGMSIQLQLLM